MFFDPDKIAASLSAYKLSDALKYIDRLGLKAVYPEYHHSFRAEIFLRELNFSKALDEIGQALGFSSDMAALHNIKGNILIELGNHSEALSSFDQAVALAPAQGQFRFNRGQLRFLMGDWVGGRKDYEFRLTDPLFSPPAEIAARPVWRGQAEVGKTVLIHWEQGQGDTLQFVRFVQLVKAQGLLPVLEVQDSLRRLIAASFPDIPVVGEQDPLPLSDYRAAIPSLPWLLETLPDSVYAPAAYLRAEASPELKRHTLSPAVGLVWAGNPNHVNDRQRSLSQEQLLGGVTAIPDVQFYSLQVGATDKQKRTLARANVIDLGTGFSDFADTAAAIQALDLVITVDTSVAHLAGALGKPVWILLPFAPDWRWLLERGDSPWYPSARLFRQPKRGDWGTVLKSVSDALTQF